MDTIIREFNNNDTHVVTKIFNEVVAEGNTFLTEKPLSITQMAYRLKNEETATFVAVSDGIVSGGYMLRPNLKGRGSHICNATYFVTKSFRGHGIGFLLGKHSLDKAKELGFNGMQFNSVVAQNESAIKVWEKLEFQKIGIIPEGYRSVNGLLIDILIFYKKL